MFVYPFVKMRSWYGLPFAERQRIMGEHFKVGRKYPKIKINTGYSFGLDDQEFVLAFEGDDPAEFLALVEELRSTEASKYTELETPIFTCVRTDAVQASQAPRLARLRVEERVVKNGDESFEGAPGQVRGALRARAKGHGWRGEQPRPRVQGRRGDAALHLARKGLAHLERRRRAATSTTSAPGGR